MTRRGGWAICCFGGVGRAGAGLGAKLGLAGPLNCEYDGAGRQLSRLAVSINGFQVPGQGWECEVLGGGPAGGGAMAACLCEQVTCWTVLVWREHGVPVLATVRACRLAGTSTLLLPSAPSPGDAVGGAKYLCRCG